MTTSTLDRPASLDRLDDERAINRLLSTYVHLLDDGKFLQVATLLRHATMEVVGVYAYSRDGIERFLNNGVQRYDDGTPRTWHSVSNIVIDTDPSSDRASSVSYFTVHRELDGFALQPICTGRYHDQFEKRDGEWRFTYRLVKAHLLGELQHHAGSPINKFMI